MSWLGIAQERQTQAVSTTVYSPFLLGPEPNKGMELTAYSVRSFLAPAFGSSSYLALGARGAEEKTKGARRRESVQFFYRAVRDKKR